MAKALIILADGFEELEAITITDLFVRAGIDIVRAGLHNKQVTASRHTQLTCDTTLDEALNEDYDIVILPGGLPGSDSLADDPRVIQCLQQRVANNALCAAICAAPRAFIKAGIAKGKLITCYPGALDTFDTQDSTLTGDAVTIDLPLVTSRGPGTAIAFALTLIELLADKDTRDTVEAGLAA